PTRAARSERAVRADITVFAASASSVVVLENVTIERRGRKGRKVKTGFLCGLRGLGVPTWRQLVRHVPGAFRNRRLTHVLHAGIVQSHPTQRLPPGRAEP